MRTIDCVAVSGMLGGLLAITACVDVAELEDTEVVLSAYSVASCATATANFTRMPPTSGLITGASYNTCTKSFVVDVPNVESQLAGGVLNVTWAGSSLTETDCPDSEGGAIFYKKVGATWVPINGQNISNGVWQPPSGGSSGFCRTPRAAFGPLEAGASYRIAATMRRLSGGNPTREIGFGFITGRAVDLTAGPNHTCARLFNSSRLRCWGSGASAKLGYGNSNNVGDDEVPSAAGDVVVETVPLVALGSLHTCMLAGGVRCWGAGASGALGYGNTSDVTTATGPNVSVGPTPFVQLVAGDNHTCVRTTGLKVRCWGAGTFGQLGYGNTNTIGDNETPASAGDVPVGADVIQVVAGANHTCVLLSLASNNVKCWGLNSHGQLGYGHTNNVGDNETPSSVGTVTLGGQASFLAAAGNQTCALMSSGRVRCWGQNTNGQLGYGHTNNIGDNEAPSSAGDVMVIGGLYTATQLTVGARHTCVVYAGGSVKCWGAASDGALGYGNTNDVGDNETPAGVGDVNLPPARSVVAGGAHTCAVLLTGQVKCWGANGKHGYPGLGPIGDNETPAAVGNVQLWGGCADGSAEQQLKGDSMSGCAGIFEYPFRRFQCAEGWTTCTAAQWVARRDGSPATHHYWTNDPLLYNGSGPGACWVSTTTGSDCGGSPMRVCAPSFSDPEGNACNWQSCGFESASPNEHFGGCVNNTTAGTLCCRP